MSFFKKPTWAVKNPSETGTDFYRRSGQTYSDIIAANREAHQKQPKAPELPEDTDDTEDTQQTKRPRLSEEKGKGRADSSPMRDVTREVDRVQIVMPKPQELSGSSRDSSPELAKSVEQRETTQTHNPENRMSQSPQKTSGPEPLGALPVKPVIVLEDDSETRSPRPVEPPQPVQPPKPAEKPADDPVVQIMITSEIANTKPLLVHRKMSQRLRDVRLAWCNRQDFDPHIQSSVYLTWKGRRLFDVTTCRSLGIDTGKSSGGILGFDDDSADQKELRVHMEAVSDLPLPVNQPTTPDNDQLPTASQPPEDDQGEPMKLILRTPGYDDFRLKARPKTLISRLITAFRDKQKIPVYQDIFLVFDGDKLDPESCLGDYDIDDLDLLDVQIK